MRLDRPNILYIHSHDTGRYVQPYGYAIPTPHIQQLAEEGVLFRKAFCAAPTCSPSRASLLSGQHAHNSGMLGLAHRGFSLHNPQQHILYTLRKEGYRCALIGEEHLAKQRALIARLKTSHRPTEDAEALLDTFEDLQRQHKAHLVLIESKDATAPGGP